MAPKQGIIPLRPVGGREILAGAFTAVRRNPHATLGISAVVMIVYGVIAVLIAPHTVTTVFPGFTVGFIAAPAPSQPGAPGHIMLVNVVLVLLVGAMLFLLTGMLTAVIGHLVLGERISADQAWRTAFPRLLAMIGAVLLSGVPLAGIWGVYALTGIGIRLVTSAGPMVIFLVVAGVPLFAVTVWLMISFALALQAVVLERAGPRDALRRSFRLVRGGWWRVFGILVLTAIILGLVSDIIDLPLQILAVALTRNGLNPPIDAVIVSAVGRALAGTVTAPVLAGTSVLLYVDLRMRKEGLDTVLQTASHGDSATGSEFASLWRPPASFGRLPGHTPPG
jgi:hypothetical protein